jgi:hypothetical protein
MTASVTGAPVTTTPAALPSISSRDEQKIRAARAAVDSLTVRHDKASEERKAIAKKKAEDLKARIQMLKMSMPASPEAVGRLIAQLARELGAVVKSYGGTGSDAGVGADVATLSATPASGAEAAGASEGAVVASGEGSEASINPDAASDAATGAAPKDPYRAALAAQEASNADRARKSAGAQQDSGFATTVKQMLAELKAMAAKAAADAKAEGDPNTPGIAEAGKALDGVDAALDGAGLSGGLVSLVV